eukprot:tig00000405_g477.t1
MLAAAAIAGAVALAASAWRRRRRGLQGIDGSTSGEEVPEIMIQLQRAAADPEDGSPPRAFRVVSVNAEAEALLGGVGQEALLSTFLSDDDVNALLEGSARCTGSSRLFRVPLRLKRSTFEGGCGVCYTGETMRVEKDLFALRLSPRECSCSKFEPNSGSLERNRAKAIVDTLVDGIISIDSSGIVQSFNQAASSIFQYDPKEVIGRNVKMLMPEPYKSEHDGYLAEYHRTGKRKIIGSGRKVKGLKRDGSTFPMFLSVSEAIVIEGGGRHYAGIVRDMTREEASSARAAETERFNQAILDTAVDGILTIDSRCIIQSANAAAARLFRRSAEEMIGQNVKILMPEPYKSQHDGYVASYLRTGVKKIIGSGREVVGLRADGSSFPMDLAVSEVQIGSAGIYFTGIVRDVTERREAIERLRAAEEFTRAIVDTAYDGILTVDEEGRILSFNCAAERIFGYRVGEALGEQSFELLLPESCRHELHDDFTSFLRTGHSRVIGRGPVPVTARRKCGVEFPMEISMAPHSTGRGRRIFTIIARDISDLTSLVEQNKRKQSLLENAADGIVSYGLDGVITARPAPPRRHRPSSGPAGRLTLWRAERERGGGAAAGAGELVGRSLVELCRGGEDEDAAEALGLGAPRPRARTRRGPSPPSPVPPPAAPRASHRPGGDGLAAVRHADGRSVPLEVSVCVPRGQGPGERALTAVIRPRAAERAALERELHRARMELIKARSGAGDALRTEHLSYLSHEIRNHLHGALSMNALLLDTRLDPAQREYAEAVQSIAGSLRHLADDILTFSASNADALRFESVAFDVEDIVESAAELFGPASFGKGVEIASYVDPRIGICKGDPHRLTQVIINLVSNSVKFTQSGHVAVTAELAPNGSPPSGRRGLEVPEAGPSAAQEPIHVRFEVRDTGMGLDEGAASRLFADFSQASPSIARQFGGAGLGLAISRRIVEAFGGRLTVYSAGPNRGCAFSFTIPLKREMRRRSGILPPWALAPVVLLIKDPAVGQFYKRKLRGLLAAGGLGGASPPSVTLVSTALQALELVEGDAAAEPAGAEGPGPGPAPGSLRPVHLLVDVRRCSEEEVARKVPWARLAALKRDNPSALTCVLLSEPRPLPAAGSPPPASGAPARPPQASRPSPTPQRSPRSARAGGLRSGGGLGARGSPHGHAHAHAHYSSRQTPSPDAGQPLVDPRLASVPGPLRHFFDAVVSKPCRARRLVTALAAPAPHPAPPRAPPRHPGHSIPRPAAPEAPRAPGRACEPVAPAAGAGRLAPEAHPAEASSAGAQVAVAMLERAGHLVDQAADGELAVAAVAATYDSAAPPPAAAPEAAGAGSSPGRRPYDIVFMDVQMPRMDGHQATRRIREMERMTARRTPIVALTGNASAADVAACEEAGMDAHISKPFRRESLLDAVLRWAQE